MSNEDLLPLVPIIVEKAKDRQSTFRLYSTPGVTTSVRYDFVMNHLEETDSMREVITFGRNIQKLAEGTANHTNARAADLLNLIALGTVMPFRALAKVRRRLKRQTRKPADMKIRTFVSHFLRINNEELEWIPPFQSSNKLNMDELLEIWQFAIPNSWLRKLAEQGKDPVTMSSVEFLGKIQ